MNNEPRTMNQKSGFSLSEVLIAVGILAIGLVCIAGTFPVGIGLATVAVERTTAAVVAEEAFAKIKLYGINLDDPTNWPADPTSECVRYENVASTTLDQTEFAYPSTGTAFERQYYWSALCRVTEQDPYLVQVTVFVSRKPGIGVEYPYRDNSADPLSGIPFPKSIPVRRVDPSGSELVKEIEIDVIDSGLAKYVSEDSVMLDTKTGKIMRVLLREKVDNGDLDRRKVILVDFVEEDRLGNEVWVVPPPVGGGRYPCIGIYQRIIKF